MLGRAVTEFFNGGVDPLNPYNWFINEYCDRIRLKKLGFTSSFNELASYKASIFVRIDIELERLQERRRKMKQAQSSQRGSYAK